MESRGEREGFRGLCTSPAVISSSCVVSAPQDLVGDSKSEKCSSVSEESQDRLLKQSPATGDPEQSGVQRESQSVLQRTPSANGAYLSRGVMDIGTSPRSSESPRLLLPSAVRTLPGHADSAQLYHDWFLTASRSQFLPMPLSLQAVPPSPHPSTHVTLQVEPACNMASSTPDTTTGSALRVTLTEPLSAIAPLDLSSMKNDHVGPSKVKERPAAETSRHCSEAKWRQASMDERVCNNLRGVLQNGSLRASQSRDS